MRSKSERSLYKFTISNITKIYCLISDEAYDIVLPQLLHLIDSDTVLKTTKEKISQNNESVNLYIENYINEISELDTASNSTPGTFIKILNIDIPSDTKIDLIKIEKSVISDLSLAEDKNLWPYLLKEHKIEFNQENLEQYYEYAGADKTLIGFLNYHSDNKYFSIGNIDIANSLINNELINDRVFEEILPISDIQIENINSKLIEEKYKNRINDLVCKNRLKLTKKN